MNEKKSTTLTVVLRFPTEEFPKETSIILEALNILPEEVKEYFVENPVMFSAEMYFRRANALCISHEDFKDCKRLIHINYHVWDYGKKKIIRTILHELAHCYLGHEAGFGKSKKFISKLENEADRLADKWLRLYSERKIP